MEPRVASQDRHYPNPAEPGGRPGAGEDASGDDFALDIKGLRVVFPGDHGEVEVTCGIDLRVRRGQIVALAGESGSGKTITALSVLRMVPPPGRITGGSIRIGVAGGGGMLNVGSLSDRELRAVRGGSVSLIPQNPFETFNPIRTIGQQMVEVLRWHGADSGPSAKRRTVDLLRRVGIPDADRRFEAFPHQLSGGLLQRASIATALLCDPVLLMADEPTTAVDATIQRQVVSLLRDLQRDRGLGILLITHDLALVREAAGYVYVMYSGRIVEQGPVESVLAAPAHPYTIGLLRSIPGLRAPLSRLTLLPGSIPDPGRRPPGCPFHPRCPLTAERAGSGGGRPAAVVHGPNQLVLTRCVEGDPGVPGQPPGLSVMSDGRRVACWEVSNL